MAWEAGKGTIICHAIGKPKTGQDFCANSDLLIYCLVQRQQLNWLAQLAFMAAARTASKPRLGCVPSTGVQGAVKAYIECYYILHRLPGSGLASLLQHQNMTPNFDAFLFPFPFSHGNGCTSCSRCDSGRALERWKLEFIPRKFEPNSARANRAWMQELLRLHL